jgi:thymidylate synthase (FAD)
MSKISVLDKGHVGLVSHMGNDLMVVNAARVSFAKESKYEQVEAEGGIVLENVLSDKDKKLIKYLAKHKHWTPFAHPQITLQIKAPISIRTQLFKHKVGFVENEVSRRYVDDTPDIYIPLWRTAPTSGAKQGSGGFIEIRSHDSNTAHIAYTMSAKMALDTYNNLLDRGIAPEQARFVLPQGTYTEWYWTGSLAAYARVCKQRLDTHAQWEVQQYAKAMSDIISPLFPESWAALFE